MGGVWKLLGAGGWLDLVYMCMSYGRLATGMEFMYHDCT